MNVANNTALIVGLAREGESLARFLLDRGARVLINDAAPARQLEKRIEAVGPQAEYFLGEDRPDLVARAQLCFVSPGVPERNSVYQAARGAGLKIQSMTTLFFDECPAPIVGITGSSGKSTTTSLLGHLIRTAHQDVVVGGNIGDPMLDLLPKITPQTVVVLELSSFQLGILERSPHIAVVTNLTPNHLDRHETMAAYVSAKRRIVDYQTARDYVVLNSDDAESGTFRSAAGQARWFGRNLPSDGATVEAGWVGVRDHGEFQRVLPVRDIPLLGRHNVENVLAAVAVANLIGVPLAAMAVAVRSYRPPSHRLETVGEIAAVRYVDDSIATSPARAVVALEAIEQPVILIAGGRDKQVPWDDFARLTAQKARGLVLIGEAASEIEQAVRHQLGGADDQLRSDMIRCCASLEQAVQTAGAMAHPGDVVLLSPACASYDMFHDFEERGAAFARAVEGLDAA